MAMKTSRNQTKHVGSSPKNGKIRVLILIRHAKALHRDKARARGMKDSDRPLTKKGIFRFTASLPSRIREIESTKIYHSPFLRAEQTAALICDQLKKLNSKCAPKMKALPSITPMSNPKFLMKKISSGAFMEPVAMIVSHEPFISNFLELAFEQKYRNEPIKKGAFVRILISDELKFRSYQIVPSISSEET